MATYSNHVTLAADRNGTTTHTVHPDGTGGTAVDGSVFTPTAGRFLLCCVEGGVTSTTATGWTLPTNGSAIANTGLYVFYRASASGTSADQVVTTHNTANYACVFDFYEFLAGTTFVSAATATGVGNGGSGPNLTGLTGSNWVAGVIGSATHAVSGTGNPATWSAGTKEVDHAVLTAATDGYSYSLAYQTDTVASSAQWSATLANEFVSAERLMFAVAAVGVTAPGIVIDFTKVI